ncbi:MULTISPECIES: IclR family transcriptional regulator [unclassified Caballeronia]|uniref:IclR family transcriptional regulator n=1 Tax=unclassified Caballeronia TaxID=2646786 RepID=UPI00285CF1FA|nr:MULTISPECIES: IclR family transcriptional regulator [unclassified Caballeronia]MDR5818717.1 IclR family transcriptional regulator [Caballeronia sp. LZ033]MDR5822703.1 IclR family transcriptional regulator [Caballeronia sp. LZ043]
MNDAVRSAARVLDLLEYFASTEEGVALTTVSTIFAMPKSSTLALLRTLLSRGYLERDDHNLYRLNPAFRSGGFGWNGDLGARLTAIAKPAMDDLCVEVGETVVLSVFTDDGQFRTVAKSLAQTVVRYDLEIDKSYPAYCGAMGRAMLACLPREKRDALLALWPLEQRTPYALSDLARINEKIDQAAIEGVAIVEEEFALDGVGIAMPICDAGGVPIAALDVGCVASRYPAKRDKILAAMRACIDRLPPPFGALTPAAPSTSPSPRESA